MRFCGNNEVRVASLSAAPGDQELQQAFDRFMDLFALLRDKGYSPDAAAQVAQDVMMGQEREPGKSLRFARTHDAGTG